METYHLFRLVPFKETHADLKRIEMSEEQMEVYFRICHAAVAVMEEEDPDDCWSCRICANFMDIHTGLEAQYAHRIAEFRKTIVAGRKDAFAKLAMLDSEDPGCYAANL